MNLSKIHWASVLLLGSWGCALPEQGGEGNSSAAAPESTPSGGTGSSAATAPSGRQDAGGTGKNVATACASDADSVSCGGLDGAAGGKSAITGDAGATPVIGCEGTCDVLPSRPPSGAIGLDRQALLAVQLTNRYASTPYDVVALGVVTTLGKTAPATDPTINLPAARFWLGIYTDNQGYPDVLLGQTSLATAANVPPALDESLDPPVRILGGMSYWVVIVTTDNAQIAIEEDDTTSPMAGTPVYWSQGGVTCMPSASTPDCPMPHLIAYPPPRLTNFIPYLYARYLLPQ